MAIYECICWDNWEYWNGFAHKESGGTIEAVCLNPEKHVAALTVWKVIHSMEGHYAMQQLKRSMQFCALLTEAEHPARGR